jgi:hypothetical protein
MSTNSAVRIRVFSDFGERLRVEPLCEQKPKLEANGADVDSVGRWR